MFTEDINLKSIILINLPTERLGSNQKVASHTYDVLHSIQQQQQDFLRSQDLLPRHQTKVNWGQDIISMVGNGLQTIWNKEGNVTYRYSYVPGFSVHRPSRSIDGSQSKWLIWCVLQRRPHLSFGSWKSFLCLQHWHCPAFMEIQAVLMLLKQSQALADNFIKSMSPCQFTWWLHTCSKSNHIWYGGPAKESNAIREQFCSFWHFPFHWQSEYITLKSWS